MPIKDGRDSPEDSAIGRAHELGPGAGEDPAEAARKRTSTSQAQTCLRQLTEEGIFR